MHAPSCLPDPRASSQSNDESSDLKHNHPATIRGHMTSGATLQVCMCNTARAESRPATSLLYRFPRLRYCNISPTIDDNEPPHVARTPAMRAASLLRPPARFDASEEKRQPPSRATLRSLCGLVPATLAPTVPTPRCSAVTSHMSPVPLPCPPRPSRACPARGRLP